MKPATVPENPRLVGGTEGYWVAKIAESERFSGIGKPIWIISIDDLVVTLWKRTFSARDREQEHGFLGNVIPALLLEIRTSTGRKIELIEEDDGWWTAVDTETGVASDGETRPDALDALDEALEGHTGAGRRPTDEELREVGIDPEENESRDLPEFLQ